VYTYPLKGAVIFSGVGNESVPIIEVSNLSFSEKNKALTLHIRPVKHYEGEVLKTFADKNIGLDSARMNKNEMTALYLETSMLNLENWGYLCCNDQDMCAMGQISCCPEASKPSTC
jgi:hypothetical protein